MEYIIGRRSDIFSEKTTLIRFYLSLEKVGFCAPCKLRAALDRMRHLKEVVEERIRIAIQI